MVIASGFVTEVGQVSVTCAVKLNVPVIVGVPDISPVLLLRLRPPGKLPETKDQLYGGNPLVAMRVSL